MPIDRRMLLLAGGTLLLPRLALSPRRAWAADDNKALFWTVTPQGRKNAVLFGYERIAPNIVPDLIKDGDALVMSSDRIVLDLPQNVRFPAMSVTRPDIKPIVQVVSPPTAERIRKLLSTPSSAALGDRISGLELAVALMSEGQHQATSTAAGAIVDYARNAGKPIDQLISEAEIRSAWQPPDLAAMNGKINEETITYLLDLREKAGPIGGYLEQLYRERDGNAIERVTAEMTRRGVISPSQFLQTDKVRELMLARALDTLTRQADETRFMMFPLGMLTGENGMLAALKAKGLSVAAWA